MQKVYYAVKHLPTGKFLPARGASRQGSTRAELTSTHPPRLFGKRGHAVVAMKSWAGGIQRNVYEFREDDYDSHIVNDPKPDRSISDLQVVEMILEEKIDAK